MKQLSKIMEWFLKQYELLEFRYQLLWVIILTMLAILLIVIISTVILSVYYSYKEKNRSRLKKSLEPLIIEFVFDDWTSRKTHLKSLKNWIKSNSHNKYSKSVLKESLLYYHSSFKGDSKKHIQWIYISLNLHIVAQKKLRKGTLTQKANLINELAQMNIYAIKGSLLPLLDHPDDRVRLEAQIAMVHLFGFEDLDFISKTQYVISDWVQIIFLEKLISSNNKSIRDPKEWIQSKNDSVVSFGLKYIQQFYILNHQEELVQLLNHPNENIIIETLETIQFLEYTDAVENVMPLVKNPDVLIQFAALECLKKIGNPSVISELEDSIDGSNSKMITIETLKTIHSIDNTYKVKNPTYQQYLSII